MPASAAFFVVAEDSSFTPCIHCGVYLWLESRAEIIFFSYRMDAARALERRADAAERVGSSSVYKQANTRLNISICCPVIAGAAQFCPLLLKPARLLRLGRPEL